MRKVLKLALLGTSILAGGEALALPRAAGTPPPWYTLDANNVDLATGQFVYNPEDISIGSGVGRLDKDFGGGVIDPDGWGGNSIDAAIRFNGSYATVRVGNVSDTFPWISTTTDSYSVQANGSRLVKSGGTYIYTMADGTRITFVTATANYTLSNRPILGDRITTPSGVSTQFIWRAIDKLNDPNCAANREPCTYGRYVRLSAKSNNAGYAIKFAYAFDGDPTTNFAGWSTLVDATALNTAVTTDCALTLSVSCSGKPGTRTVRYGVNTVTDPEGRVTTYANGSITLPGSTSPDLTLTYDGAGRVASVSRRIGTTTYRYAEATNRRTVTVTDPTNVVRTVVIDTTIERPISDTVNGKTTAIEYNAAGLATKVTAPEGNYTTYAYDARGI